MVRGLRSAIAPWGRLMTPTEFLGSSREKAADQTGTATSATVDRLLAWSIAVAAAAGGLIHLKASADHRHLAVVATGFVAMGLSQLLFAGVMFLRPSRPSLALGGAFHAGILFVWILSRTIGLPFIPGAQQSASVGVADLVANTFSMAVAGTAAVAFAVGGAGRTDQLLPRVISTIKAVVLTGVLILTVAALTEVHDHDHPEAGTTPPGTGDNDSDPSTPTTHSDDRHHHPGPSSGWPRGAVPLGDGWSVVPGPRIRS